MFLEIKKQGRIWALLVTLAMVFTILPVVPTSAALTHAVTFDTAGGAPVPAVQNVTYGAYAVKPAMDPTKAGNKFTGWFDTAVGGSEWDFPNNPITVDTTIYAQWVPDTTYKVELILNGGNLKPGVDAIMHVPYNTQAQEPTPPPTKGGYNFKGWFSDAALTTPYDFTTPVTQDIDLYAKWQKKIAGGGGGEAPPPVEDQTKKDDTQDEQGGDSGGDDSEESKQTVFSDTSGHWAEESIREAVNKGFVEGYPNGTFAPGSFITRAEFICMIVKAFELPTNEEGPVFVDTEDHWAKEVIATAAAAGIVSGFDEEYFRPDQLISREQMASIAARATTLPDVAEGRIFTDQADISDWAVDNVKAVSGNGIMTGYPDGSFRPQELATRAEAVVVVLKTLNFK